MKWQVFDVGPIHENCYLLSDPLTKKALIIDPGDEFERLKASFLEEGVQPLAVLLTHAHFDHIGALDQVREFWRIPAYLHEREADWLEEPQKNGSAFFGFIPDIHQKKADYLFKGSQQLTIGPFTFSVLETPGHSPGGVSFYFAADHVVFCGDALFRESIGRADGFGANPQQLLCSIKEKLLTLDPETVACPGHGPETTIGWEKVNNPFLLK